METHCEKCGASLKQRWDRITAGEVDFLIRFRELVIANNKNLVNVPKEMNLSNIEYSDFQKLRYHALIAKFKENKMAKRGWWVLTHRGNLFVIGEIKIAEKVRIFRNKITGYSENEVSIREVLKTDPYWDNKDTIQFEPATMDVIENSKAEIIRKAKKSKVKNPCPKCGVQMKIVFKSEFNKETQTYKVDRSITNLKCPKCGETDFLL